MSRAVINRAIEHDGDTIVIGDLTGIRILYKPIPQKEITIISLLLSFNAWYNLTKESRDKGR
jgi:hypothetical protein